MLARSSKVSRTARHASNRTAKGTAMNQRKMRIGMSIRGHGYHPAAQVAIRTFRPTARCRSRHYLRSAQTAERGKIDMIFFADGAGIRQGDNPPGSLARTGRDMIELEPTMLLPALAMVTSHIGLVTTASTTYNEPYNLARRFATLDLISKGRAGWNVVASWSEHEAQNFGLETTLDYGHALRAFSRSSSTWSRAYGTVGTTVLCCSTSRAASLFR